jgi:Mn-dependent DtxR family transcriptional regulator
MLTNNAQRVFDLLLAVSGGDIADTSWTELSGAAHISRNSVAAAIRELKAAGLVEQIGGGGCKSRYRLRRRPTSPNQSKPVQTGLSDESELISDDDERARQNSQTIIDQDALKRALALLDEFCISEPTRTPLAVQIAAHIAAQPDAVTAIRATCERTMRETTWRNPRGVIVQRLRAIAAGQQQDPLPLFAAIIQSSPARPRRQRQSTGYRRA